MEGYIIQNKNLKVKISSLGAQMLSVNYKGKERSWQGSDGQWSDHAPLLFPVCGKCKEILNGKDYNLPFHGFAYTSDFNLVRKDDNSILLSLIYSNDTLKIYPFKFKFSVLYAVKNSKVIVKYFIENLGDKPMYFSCGAHDSFMVDKNIENYYVKFSKKENLIHYSEENGLLTGKTTDYGTSKILSFKGTELKDDYSLIFQDIKSNSITMFDESNNKVCKVFYKNFDVILFWRYENTNMVCIEPWRNLPDSVDEKKIEFPNKKGIIELMPKSKKTFIRGIKYY